MKPKVWPASGTQVLPALTPRPWSALAHTSVTFPRISVANFPRISVAVYNHPRGCDDSFSSHGKSPEPSIDRWPPSASVTIAGIVDAAAATPRSRQRVRGRQERLTARRGRRRPDHPTRLPRSVHLAVRWPSRTCSGAASGPPPNRERLRDDSSAALVAVVEVVLTGCLRDMLRILADCDGPIHIVRPLAIKVRLPCASRMPPGPSTRLRRFLHLAYPSSIKDCLPRASGTSSGSSARLRRPIHVAPPVPLAACSPAAFGTAFGPSAPVYPPRLPSVTPTSSV